MRDTTHHDTNQSTLTEAQDTSSPTNQQSVATALLDDEQSPLVLQLKRQRGQPINDILIGVAIALIAMGVTICVLNIIGTIKGPWSSIFGIIMAATGVVISLIRLIYEQELTAKITIYSGQVTEIDLR